MKESKDISNHFLPSNIEALVDVGSRTKVLEQLCKDINLSGLSSDSINLESLHLFWESFCQFVEDLLNRQPEKFRAFIYRVDLNEASVLEVYEREEAKEAIVQISKLIILREIQKVESRKLYGS